MRFPLLLALAIAGNGVLPAHAADQQAAKAVLGKWRLDRSPAVISSEGFKKAGPEEQKKLLEALASIPTATLEITDSKLLITEVGQTQTIGYSVTSAEGRTLKLATAAQGRQGEMKIDVIDRDTIRLVDASGEAVFKRIDSSWEKADLRKSVQGKWRFDQQAVREQTLGLHNMTPPTGAALSFLELAQPMELEITATTLSITAENAPDDKETRAGRYEVRSVAGRVLTLTTNAAGSGNEQMTLELTDADSLLLSFAGQDPGDPPLPLRRVARP